MNMLDYMWSLVAVMEKCTVKYAYGFIVVGKRSTKISFNSLHKII